MKAHTSILAAVLAAALSSPASGQTDDAARLEAERLFEEALSLMDKYDFAAACPKLEKVVLLQPQGIGAKLKLAECHVSRGKLLRAIELLEEAATLATSANQAERAAAAKERRTTLEARLAKLTISLEPGRFPSETLRVVRDGRPMDPRELDKPIAVDPGPHTVEARAAGKKPFGTKLVLVEGGAKRVVLSLDAETTPAFTDQLPPAAASRDEPATPDASRGSGLRTAGWVTGGAGIAVGLAGAIVVGIGISAQYDAVEAYSAAKEAKDAAAVDAATDDHASASTQSTVGWIMAGTGGTALATGILMVVLAPEDAPPRGTGGVTPWANPTGAGVAWGATW